ncbi:hypothetical protein SCA6_013525 [Theobroma cacao]
MDYKSLTISIAVTIAVAILANHVVSTRGFSGQKETEQMVEVKTINKHATTKTIKTTFGDIFDCVDIHRQPTLLHPLLKNHKIEMRPGSALHRNLKNSSFSTESSSSTNVAKLVGLGKGCPKGTVPIRRTVGKENMIRSFDYNKFGKNLSIDFPIKESGGTGYDNAGIVLRPESGKLIKGAAANLIIYQPKVKDHQFSGAIIEVSNGMPGNAGAIHLGWMVDPLYFGDGQPRLFAAWAQASNGKLSGCYNMDCPGFVQVNRYATFGSTFSHVSEINGPQYGTHMSLTVEPSGNWWVNIQNVGIGYFANEFFTGLRAGADLTLWGGTVYSPFPSSPPMGSGLKYNGGPFRRTCYMIQVGYVNQDDGHRYSDPNPSSVQVKESRCYLVGKNRYVDDKWRYTFFFGGEGGDFHSCRY